MNSVFSDFQDALLPYSFENKKVIRIFEIALLMEGHVLIEDLPGVGKTTFSKAFAALTGKSFSRVQGTSDLLPSDILGGEVVHLQTKEISVRKGPIFAELLLIDEINRMHPKTQSAFLEAMEEKTVTIAGEKFSLPGQHMILATQNPIEQEGTNVLPEAQRDRFACKISLGFPPAHLEEKMIQNLAKGGDDSIKSISAVLSEETISSAKEATEQVFFSELLAKKLVEFAAWTREDERFQYGISLRGVQILARAMKANAFLEGRDFVTAEDGTDILFSFIAHRIAFHEAFSDQQVRTLLTKKYAEIF